jgi:hypothetical protein
MQMAHNGVRRIYEAAEISPCDRKLLRARGEVGGVNNLAIMFHEGGYRDSQYSIHPKPVMSHLSVFTGLKKLTLVIWSYGLLKVSSALGIVSFA